MSHWSIKAKLISLCTFLLMMIVVVAAVGWSSVRKVESRLIQVSDLELPAVRNMTLVDMMHDGLRAVVYRALVAGKGNVHEIKQEHHEMSEHVHEYLNNIEKLQLSTETEQALQSVKPLLIEYIQITQKTVDLAVEGKQDEALSTIPNVEKSFSALEEKLGALGDRIESESETTSLLAKQEANSARRLDLIITVFALTVGSLAIFLLLRSLLGSLRQISHQLKETVVSVSDMAAQITERSEELAESNHQQSSSLQETTASLEEISAMTQKSSAHSVETAQSSDRSKQKSEEGRKAMGSMVDSMNAISASQQRVIHQVQIGNQKMIEIAQVIQEVGKKTVVINDIVFQTKLLSFNASVEAARAGEHGKGFAVVAEEVGVLAQMSGNAAHEINQMLTESTSRVEKIVQESQSQIDLLIQEGKTKVDTGIRVAQDCSHILNEIWENVSHVSGLASEISTASREQSQGIQEINKAMTQLESITQQNTTNSNLSADSARALEDQSNRLKLAFESLDLLVNGRPQKTSRSTQFLKQQGLPGRRAA